MKRSLIMMLVIICLFSFGGPTFAESYEYNAGYNWKNVAYGGGGFVTGLVMHPQDKTGIYVRTDVGGAYKWDEENNKWKNLCEQFSMNDGNLYGIDGIALDPEDADIVYICAGKYDAERAERYQLWVNGKAKYPPCDVLKSTDGGETWVSTGLEKTFNGNGTNRSMGEPIMVDPLNSDKILTFARDNRLYCSEDAAESWYEVTGFPQIPVSGNSEGLLEGYARIILFDNSEEGEYTRKVYAGIYNYGVYMSNDGGKSWANISEQNGPNQPCRMVTDPESGILYVADANGVFKYENNNWQDITPTGTYKKYTAIDVDPNNPQRIYCLRTQGDGGRLFRGHIMRSDDGGKTWTDMYKSAEEIHTTDSWAPERHFMANVSCLKVNPLNSKEVWLSDWYGVWKTFDIDKEPKQIWINDINGIEEMVAFTALSIPGGEYKLITGNADNDGAVWKDDVYEYPVNIQHFNDTTDTNDLDFCEEMPNIVVRASGNGSLGRWGYSTDYGKTWTQFKTFPNNAAGPMLSGRICISSQVNSETKNPALMIMPVQSPIYYSHDMGATWKESKGGPSNLISGRFAWSYNFSSDRVVGDVFYAYAGGAFYVSRDGGANFTQTVSDLPGYSRSFVRAAPYMPGEVWVALGFDGLYRSGDYGRNFEKVENITIAYMISFGKEAPGRTNPTLFLYGEVNGENGIFRTVDMGKTWVKINDDKHQMGCEPTCLTGDRNTFGVVYIGTNGNGYWCGEPQKADELLEIEKNAANITVSNNITDIEPEDDTGIKIYIDGEKIGSGGKAEVVNDRIMVPVSEFCDAVGLEVMLENTSGVAVIKNGSDVIYILENDSRIMVNKEKKDAYLSPYMKDSSLMVSARCLSELGGYDIEWNQEQNTLYLTKKEVEE